MDDFISDERLDKCEKAIEDLQHALQIPPNATVGGKDNQLAELLILARKNEEAIGKIDAYINTELRGRLGRITQDLRARKASS